MQDRSYIQLRRLLSDSRFESYRLSDNDSDGIIWERYLWNIQLSEALYPTLSLLEVALRNQLHQALAKHWGNETWYDGENRLSPSEEREIKKAKEHLIQRGKEPVPGRLIAELNFGFWTSLLHPFYDQALWPKLIPDVFPDAPRWTRERKKLLKRLNAFRMLRNRVSHSEPIWSWDNLPTIHQDILDTIHWMCPPAKDAISRIDRFSEVYRLNKSISLCLD